MTFFILRNPADGERVITEDEASYPGWAKLGEALRPPGDFEDFDEAAGAYVLNLERKADVEELGEITDRERLRQIIRNARARIATLETRQAQLIAAAQDHAARIAALEAR